MSGKLLDPRRWACALIAAWLAVAMQEVTAQTIVSPAAAATNHPPSPSLAAPAAPATPPLQEEKARAEKWEQLRTSCINGRRRICAKVLQIVPGGLVVDSGYADLLRPELSRSWVAPGNVAASRPPDLIEQNVPGAICVGLIFLTDLPKKRAVKPYDYVILEAYPAGQYEYAPVPKVKKMIRRFSVGLVTAVQLNLDTGEK